MEKEMLRERMANALEDHCFKDKDGLFYDEIYADYRDEMGMDNIKDVLSSDDPMSRFYEYFEDAYADERWRLEDQISDKLREDPELAAAYEENEDLFRDTLFELYYVKEPLDHFLDQDVEINIVLDTGDCNYDFTKNSFAHGYYWDPEDGVEEESSLLWLCRQQGVSKEELEQALKTGECYPKRISAMISHHTELHKQMKELGYVSDKPMDRYNQKDAFKKLFGAEELVRTSTRSVEKQRANLADCDLSYEGFCEKWMSIPGNMKNNRQPPTREHWHQRVADTRPRVVAALEQAQADLSAHEATLAELLKDPEVARAAQLRDELRSLNEEYIPMTFSEEYKKGKFLESVIRESANTTSHMNALAALVKLPLREAIRLAEVIQSEKQLNDSYYPDDRKGKSSIVLDKDAVLGLYDSWNGAGGLFEIELHQPLEIPVSLIYDANIDGFLGYGIQSIYGGLEYSESLREIRKVPPELTKKPLDQALKDARNVADSQPVQSQNEHYFSSPERQ